MNGLRQPHPLRLLAATMLMVAALLPASAALQAALPAYRAEQKVGGTLTAAGNRATDPLMKAWVAGFRRVQPGVTITLRNDTRVSTGAFDAAIAGDSIDLIPAARELVPSEVERLTAKLGGPPLVVAVATGSYATKSATHALAFYVNAANPLRRITIDQLRRIYGPAGDITRWGQLGLKGDWAERPINVFSVPIADPNGNPLGITNYLYHRLFDGRPGMRRSIHQIDTTGPGLERHMLANIVRQIGGDRDAIGFSGFAFATSRVGRLEIAETDAGPWFIGTLEEVAARTYPLTRTIYIAVNRRADAPPPPPIREFLSYVLSRDGQALLAGEAQVYLPLTPAFAAEQRDKIKMTRPRPSASLHERGD